METGGATTQITNGDSDTDTADQTGTGSPACPDGVVNGIDEVCDDDNLVDGDGCNSDCQPSGMVAWTQYGDSTADQFGQVVAFDAAGNVFVAGDHRDDLMPSVDQFIVSYSPGGTLRWSAEVSGNTSPGFTAMVVTTTGDIIIAGGGEAKSATLTRFDNAGTNLVPGGEAVPAEIVDTGGIVATDDGGWVIAGATDAGWAMARQATDGVVVWEVQEVGEVRRLWAWGANITALERACGQAAVSRWSGAGDLQWRTPIACDSRGAVAPDGMVIVAGLSDAVPCVLGPDGEPSTDERLETLDALPGPLADERRGMVFAADGALVRVEWIASNTVIVHKVLPSLAGWTTQTTMSAAYALPQAVAVAPDGAIAVSGVAAERGNAWLVMRLTP